MKRKLFNLAARLSLLLFVATAGLWALSYRWAAWLVVQPPPHNNTSFAILSDRGAFELDLANGTDDLRVPGSGWSIDFFTHRAYWNDDPLEFGALRRLWFGYNPWGDPWRGVVFIPHWTILLATGALPFVWWRRRKSKRSGHCLICSYDLTGNVSGICPECGTAAREPP